MNLKHKNILSIVLALLVLLSCIPIAAFGEEAGMTQELLVSNDPIKGKIVLEKQGLMLTGFEEKEDPLGYTVQMPVYENGHPQGAVFEVRAAEDIVGKDQTQWYKADEVAAVITTSGTGADESPLLPLGHYYVVETQAPVGYVCDAVRHDVVLSAKDNQTPVVEVQLTASNDYLPAEVSLCKEKEVVTRSVGKDDMVQTMLATVPGEGFIFGLYNAAPISYNGGELAADTLIAVDTTDAEGKLSIAGMFPHGEYYFKELYAPTGWLIAEELFPISILPENHAEDNVIHAALADPIVNKLIHAPITIAKTDIAGTEYLPDTLVEVRDSEEEIVLRAHTGEDGRTPPFHATPGDYVLREVTAPQGYELSTEELPFTVDAEGHVVGHTTIMDDFNRFSVQKVDESHAPLAGVVFGLYDKDGTLVCTATTDENGLAAFEKIPYGSYFVQELTPLPGYLRDYTRVPVTIDGHYINPQEPLATITNCPTEILLSKVDQNGAALAGAKFGLYSAGGKLVMTAVSDAEGLIRFTHVPYGSYMIHEITAPDGYLLSTKIVKVTIGEGYKNPEKPTATLVNHLKHIQCIKVDPSGKPLPGVEFSLINARTGKVAEVVTSDQNGVFTFTQFSFGSWIIRESAAPEGYSRMEDKRFTVGDDWKEPDPIMCVNIPNHYEFLKTDASGTPMVGVKFRLEDESGKNLGTYTSDKDGVVRITDLAPGTYYIKETETLEGFSVSGETIRIRLDEHYVVPDQMRKMVNYTVIQTGVNMAVTAATWVGIGLIVLSGVVTIIRKRKKHGQQTK